MKFILSLLLVGVIISTAFSQLPVPEPSEPKPPVRVYMIQDPGEGVWYRTNPFGLTGWGEQTQGRVWTTKKKALSTLGGLYGTRASRCVVKTFVLLPVEDK